MGLFSSKPEPKASPPQARARAESATSPSATAGPEAPTVIGKEALVKGDLTSTRDILVEGRVEGRIEGEHRVVIGRSGVVKAEVRAEVISVQGEVHGNCEGLKKIEITSTGKVFGDITAGLIEVDEGATFRGSSKMTRPSRPAPRAEPVAASSPKSPPAATKPQ